MTTKFHQNAIVQNGKKFSVWYSLSEKSITIYEERYTSLRGLEGFPIVNNSDSMTDYFENSRFTLNEGDEYYKEAVKAARAKQLSRARSREKKVAKREEELASVAEKIKVKGAWYEVISKDVHPIYPEMTRYSLKKIGGRAKKMYKYAESADGKRYCPIYVAGNL